MITVGFSIPEMVNVPSGAPEVYLWFAFLWADIHTFSNPQVLVPYLPDSRQLTQDTNGVIVTQQHTTFQIDLDDGGNGLAAAGVVIALFERHDTPEDAINKGYEALGPAIQGQVQLFLKANGPVAPTGKQIDDMVKAIADEVRSAVMSRLNDLEKIFLNHDKQVGYSYLLLLGPEQMQVGEGGGVPNIIDPSNHYSQCSFPGGGIGVGTKLGPDPCARQIEAVHKATATLLDLTGQIRNLEMQLQTAGHLERQKLRLQISNIRKNQLPVATAASVKTQRALQVCRLGSGVKLA
jgi:hypothetical protein